MIRLAEERDVESLMEIYNYEVLNGVSTFDTEVKTYDERLCWFKAHADKYRLIVSEENGKTLGYASLSPYNLRGAFYPTAEISVYVDKNCRGRGVGKALMRRMLSIAKEEKSFSTILAQITSENAVSKRLHEELGFKYVGTLNDVGFKFNRFLSLDIYEYSLKNESINGGNLG